MQRFLAVQERLRFLPRERIEQSFPRVVKRRVAKDATVSPLIPNCIQLNSNGGQKTLVSVILSTILHYCRMQIGIKYDLRDASGLCRPEDTDSCWPWTGRTRGCIVCSLAGWLKSSDEIKKNSCMMEDFSRGVFRLAANSVV